ncbi:MAG TPA: xylulokinase [Lapillicoccus sp.]|nr:xylulokinase [Lapillicoccus sp.]
MTERVLVAGVDSSTQSTKVVVCDAATGEIVREGRAAHPDGTEVDPASWWAAYEEATSAGLLEDVRAIAVAGQQHGMVALDEDRNVVRKALLWNDTRSAEAAADLVRELGGAQAWADAVGTVPLASITVAKLRWFAQHEPELAERTHDVVLPHDWLTAQIVGSGSASGVRLVTDRGDASGTGYWAPSSGTYRTDLLERAFGRAVGVPEVLGPAEVAGETSDGLLVGPGTGDNMGAALGLGLGPGDIVVSLGTSGTVFGVAEAPTADPTGFVAGFADATGRYLPLVCTLNAARVLTAAATMLGTDHAGLDRLALSARPGAGGLTLLPYLDGERTPDLPDATGTLGGLTRANLTPANVARAAVEGMLCGLADGLDALRDNGVPVQRVLLIGGAARSTAVQAVASGIFGVPVSVPSPGEYVALGAARQAAWVLGRSRDPADEGPDWSVAVDEVPESGGDWADEVREAYTRLRRQMHGI